MPGPLDFTREPAARIGGRFDEALAIVKNEFRGLSPDEQYVNSFARLLKWDPLGRVSMLGTDQRDMFAAELRALIRSRLRPACGVFDIGCGDGQTFSLIAEALPAGATISFQDPNPLYVQEYEAALRHYSHLCVGGSACAPFSPENGLAPNQFDLIMAIHVLYYFDDLERAVTEIYRLLKPGGAAFIVFADESAAYTGHALRAYYAAIGDNNAVRDHTALCRHRLCLFTQDGIAEILSNAFPANPPVTQIEVQRSRLYGHSLADILALCNITGLDKVADLSKFDTTAKLLRISPESVQFRIEADEGPRAGMLSVVQPQVVVTIEKR
jgi:SAM-dependent methyltransferase